MKNLLISLVSVFLLLNAPAFANKSIAQEQEMFKISIKVNYALNQPGDTLTLSFGPQSNQQRIKTIYHEIVGKDGICSFNIDQEFGYGYISISKVKKHPKWRNDSQLLINNLFWENGDEISINIPDNKNVGDYLTNTVFTGKGATKYNTLYKIRKEQENFYIDAQADSNLATGFFLNPLVDTIPISHNKNNRLIAVLDKGKSSMSKLAYDVLKTDILMTDRAQASHMVEYYYRFKLKESRQEPVKYIKRIHELFFPYPILHTSDEGIAASYQFQKCYSEIFYTLALLQNENSVIKTAVEEIKHIGNGIKEESIMLSTLNKLGVKTNQEGINEVKQFIKTPRYKLMLNKQLDFVGKFILGYSFIDTLGNNIELSDYKGKLLLIDFWFSGCGGCAYYYQNVLSKIEEEFRHDTRFAVVSISCDKEMDKWLSAIRSHRYTNEDCINLSTGSVGTVHPFFADLGIFLFPYVMLVDQNGNLIESNTPTLTKSVETLRTIIEKHL